MTAKVPVSQAISTISRRDTLVLRLEERRRTLADFKAGRFKVLVGCDVLTEGFDEPSIGCILMARPTKSRALYQQCIGRGLRLHPAGGKTDCLVLDVVDNSRRHSLVTATSLMGVETVDAGGRDLREVLKGEEERRREEERHRKEEEDRLRASTVAVSIKLEPVDPFRPDGPNLDGYRPTEPWHDDTATERQKTALSRRGIPTPRNLTKGEANWLLDQPTPNQKRFLKWKGRWREELTFSEASERINAIKNYRSVPW